jgi:hypothetical protein
MGRGGKCTLQVPGRQGLRYYKKEEDMMDWGITSLDELQRMKKRMDQTWSELFEENSVKERDISLYIEKLPKFEGTRRTPKSRSKKVIRFFQ